MLKQEFESFQKQAQAKSINVNGVEWNYFVNGNGDQTILILTGGGSIAEAAFVYINSLSKTHRVITPTLPEVHTVEESLAGIKAILDQENAETVNILGFSMGGMLAQCFVRKYPEVVSKLTFYVSMPPSPEYGKKYAKYKKGISIVPNSLFRWISKRSLRKQILVERDKASPEDIEFWIGFFNWVFDSGKMSKQMLLGTSDVLIDYFNNYNFTPQDLANWQGKVMIIESDKDKVIEPQERERFKALYPHAEIIVQEGSGHFGEGLLNPQKAISLIQEFFTN